MDAIAAVRAIALDFDGTIANTFVPSPAGVDVNHACRIAVREIFGENIFDKAGGLRNRAPLEFIRAVIAMAPQELLRNAKTFLGSRQSELEGLVPKGGGVPLVWSDIEPEPVVAEIFVRVKLSILAREIGNSSSGVWPAPCGDVLGFLTQIKRFGIPYAILSSGHTCFIQRVFKLWEHECPRTVVTDDDLRGCRVPQEQRSKPSRFVFSRLMAAWERDDTRIAAVNRNNILYIGDDPTKDGKLAENAGIRFAWFNPHEVSFPKGGIRPYIEIKNFSELIR